MPWDAHLPSYSPVSGRRESISPSSTPLNPACLTPSFPFLLSYPKPISRESQYGDETKRLADVRRRYGTAKSGVGISAMAVLRPDLMMKCVVPVIMAGIIAIVCFLRLSLVLSLMVR